MPTRSTKMTRLRHGWLLTIQSPSISHSALLKHLSSVADLEHYCIFDVYAPANCTNFASVSGHHVQEHLRRHFLDPTYEHPYFDTILNMPNIKTNRHISAYIHLKKPVTFEAIINDYFHIASEDISPYTQIPCAAFQTRYNTALACNGPLLTSLSPILSVPRADLPRVPATIVSYIKITE